MNPVDGGQEMIDADTSASVARHINITEPTGLFEGLQRRGNNCKPDLKRGTFSEEEEDVIYRLYAVVGSRWSMIAARLPGRTDKEVKNLCNSRLKKKLMGLHPDNHKRLSEVENGEDNARIEVPARSHEMIDATVSGLMFHQHDIENFNWLEGGDGHETIDVTTNGSTSDQNSTESTNSFEGDTSVSSLQPVNEGNFPLVTTVAPVASQVTVVENFPSMFPTDMATLLHDFAASHPGFQLPLTKSIVFRKVAYHAFVEAYRFLTGHTLLELLKDHKEVAISHLLALKDFGFEGLWLEDASHSLQHPLDATEDLSQIISEESACSDRFNSLKLEAVQLSDRLAIIETEAGKVMDEVEALSKRRKFAEDAQRALDVPFRM